MKRNYITTVLDEETAAAVKWGAKYCNLTVCEFVKELILRELHKLQVIDKYRQQKDKEYENNNRDTGTANTTD